MTYLIVYGVIALAIFIDSFLSLAKEHETIEPHDLLGITCISVGWGPILVVFVCAVVFLFITQELFQLFLNYVWTPLHKFLRK